MLHSIPNFNHGDAHPSLMVNQPLTQRANESQRLQCLVDAFIVRFQTRNSGGIVGSGTVPEGFSSFPPLVLFSKSGAPLRTPA